MTAGFLIMIVVITILAIYMYYRLSVLHYAKLNKNLILRIRTKSNLTYFFILTTILFLYFLFFVSNEINYSTLVLLMMFVPKYIVLAICDSNLFIFKDRLVPGNSPMLFNKIKGIEINETKNKNFCEFLIKESNSTYIEKIYSRDKETLIAALRPLLGEDIEFKY